MATSTSSRDLPNTSLKVTPEMALVVSESPIRSPKSGEVLLHVKATGLCGSDIHIWKHGGFGPTVTVGNHHILGHEGAGVVLEVSPDVQDVFRPGDRVAIEPQVVCGSCISCETGNRNMCDRSTFRGVYDSAGGELDGTCQRFMVHPAKYLHRLPNNMTFAEGALLEPLSVSLQGVRNANIGIGAPALVCGAGPIGLTAAACARAAGAHPIVITDVEPKRLEFAKFFMPTIHTFLVDKTKAPMETAAELRKLFAQIFPARNRVMDEESLSPAAVLECTGVGTSIVTGLAACRKAGTVMVLGVAQQVLDGFPASLLVQKQITIKWSRAYQQTWPAAINLIAGGLININGLVTHQFPLEEADKALEFASDPSKGGVKVQIVDEVDIV